jgi:hypothetical protein
VFNSGAEIPDVDPTVQGIHLMSYANQIVEGFLDKIQDVGLIATLNLLMKNAHPIVKIIKVIQDVKIFVKRIPVTQRVKALSCLDSQGLLIKVRQLQLPQQQQQDGHKHQELADKNPFNQQ